MPVLFSAVLASYHSIFLLQNTHGVLKQAVESLPVH
jgi:hypothetical protein